MKKLIIIDLNRTLYDPNTGALVEGASALLSDLSVEGNTLVLMSRIEPGRGDIIKELGIEKYFAEMRFVNSKSAEEFIALAKKYDAKDVYIIGDYMYDEIREGNKAGFKTIQVLEHAIADLNPESDLDVPWREARTIRHVRELINS